MTDKLNPRAVTLTEALQCVGAIVETHSFLDYVTGAHWPVRGIEALESDRSRAIVYTLDGGRYVVTRGADGAMVAEAGETSYVTNPEWRAGYDTGFADGANNADAPQEVLDAAQAALYWLQAERDSSEPGATIPGDVIAKLETALSPYEDANVGASMTARFDVERELVRAARDALADSEGYARTFAAQSIAPDDRPIIARRIRERCERLRAAIKAMESFQ